MLLANINKYMGVRDTSSTTRTVLSSASTELKTFVYAVVLRYGISLVQYSLVILI